jgi:UDP-2,3-diacylglucosamine pyrophosphatase LpxH
MTATPAPRRYRTLFISDLHLGTRGCQVGQLIEFLSTHDADTIYLVGDIIDGWQLHSGWYWPSSHTEALRLIAAKANAGSRVVYLPGNHDEFARDYCGARAGAFEITDRAIHEAADGKRYLIVHGDCFDVVHDRAKWLAFIGDHLYVAALALNTAMNRVGKLFGLPYWSFSNWAKMKVKSVVNFMSRYEEMLTDAAREHSVDGVVCGHIHKVALHDDFGITYVNCGDWVESCTAVVEHDDGRLEILRSAPASESQPVDAEVEEAVA